MTSTANEATGTYMDDAILNTPDTRDRTQRPVAVYGTLREGEGNWSWAIQPYGVKARKAVILNHAMYPMPGFPFIIPQHGAKIVVDIFDFTPDVWDKALDDLDMLEGYYGEDAGGNLYNRRVVTAITEDGEEVEVYTYIASDEAGIRAKYDYFPEGDWIIYSASLPKFEASKSESHSDDVLISIIQEIAEASSEHHDAVNNSYHPHELENAETEYKDALNSIYERYPSDAVNHAVHLINTYGQDDEGDADDDTKYDPEQDDYWVESDTSKSVTPEDDEYYDVTKDPTSEFYEAESDIIPVTVDTPPWEKV